MPIAFAVVLLAAPLGASLPALAPAPVLPADLSNGDLLRLIAARLGIPLREHAVVIPPGASVRGLAEALSERTGIGMTPEELDSLNGIPPRVAGPILVLLAASLQAADLRDEALAAWSEEDFARAMTLDPSSPDAAELAATVDKQAMYESAILLLDTLEGIVIPALQDAIDSGAWPNRLIDTPVLRLGTMQNDRINEFDRLIQIDPRGDDFYGNNAGGSALITKTPILISARVESQLGIHVDFGGNDTYDRIEQASTRHPAYGSGTIGVGIHLELGGNDSYVGGKFSGGTGSYGIGLLHDAAGTDSRYLGDYSNGYGNVLGILRDDKGDDDYRGGFFSGGATVGRLSESLGLLWDRAGTELYGTHSVSIGEAYGWADEGATGLGWIVDEGPETDDYAVSRVGLDSHGCNDCEWTGGGAPGGMGNDNSGGLARMLAAHPPFLRTLV